MIGQPGLRERKKQRTREQIAATAWRLFVERGFERVSVAEIARAADVAQATVFNYFPTKEDLVYGRMSAFEERMAEAIRERPPGEPVIDAFGRFVLEPGGYLASDAPEAAAALAAANRVVAASPALLARERQLFDASTRSLAALIAHEWGAQTADLEAWVAANALVGVHRAIVGYVRREILAGTDLSTIRTGYREVGARALERLRLGLGSAPRPEGPPR